MVDDEPTIQSNLAKVMAVWHEVPASILHLPGTHTFVTLSHTLTTRDSDTSISQQKERKIVARVRVELYLEGTRGEGDGVQSQ